MDFKELNTRTLGKYFEQLLILQLLKSDFDVFTPVLDRGIDLIVKRREKELQYFEVQVKSVRKKGGRLTIREDFFPQSSNLFLVFFNVAEKIEVYVIPAKDVHSIFQSQIQNKKPILRLYTTASDLEKIKGYKWNWDQDQLPEIWKI